MPERIEFYLRKDPYGPFSNFWRQTEIVDGIWYRTNEHYYQSMRAKDPEMQRWIREAPKAWAAMKAGRSLRPKEHVDDWENKRVEVMLTGLRAKFKKGYCNVLENPLVTQLLATGDAILVEASPADMFWGGLLPGSQNMLGKLLMQVREELRHV